jgi:DNA-binding response OmpR family regulator
MTDQTISLASAGSVLVVDDSRTMRALIVQALTGAGFVAQECESGEEALELTGATPERFDAVVLDVTLPGKDGYEVLQSLQENPATSAIPVLLITASATSTHDVLRGLRGGAADHLAKPFDPSILVAKVQAFSQRRRSDRTLRYKLLLAERNASAAATLPPGVGSVVAARYRLERLLGTGATATVFEAEDIELRERVAIKIFNQSEDEDALARFKRELSVSRQMVHPNIVRVYELGSHEGMRYFTMELLEGVDLRTRMVAKPPFVALLDYLLQACTGLQAAHDRGVVHRDIKPENFFVTTSDVLKIMDFGIAKRAASTSVTVVGTMAGTPAYIAPEQITGFSSVTSAADLYSLGVIAYEMFTRSLPFDHEDTYPLMMMHIGDEPEPARKRNPAIPSDLEGVIAKLMAKKPEDRFKTASEVGRRLVEIRNRLAMEGTG